MRELKVKQDGQRVLLGSSDKLIADMPWQAALALGKALISQAKRAEEEACASQIIYDHAILTRAGVNVGLSNHPKILQEVKKEAVYNSDLRRYMPGGVKSKEVFGTPTVTQE